ncbi:MAG: gluconeogenesis factor YvcK family protein [Vampirovibrionales bacterium]|nr:gluconeogenesis factor YvcK family protein [Vampirovibrionales bacterium]
MFRRRLQWLAPGLAIKRWVFLMALGIACLLVGVALVANLQPVNTAIQWIREVAAIVPSYISGPVFLLLGMIVFRLGINRSVGTLKTALAVQGNDSLLEKLIRQHKLARGPKIVALGGGTGLSTLLRGLKHYSSNITAVVSVGDDGGSSGRLRTEHGIIPPGDIRNCLAALADEEHLITELFQYRFKSGQGLEGHSFGNLFLTAMCRVTGDMVSAIKESSNVLNIRGRVLPATLDNICLIADMEDGSSVRGESQIPEAQGHILLLRCEPEAPEALPEVLQAIQAADLIILGPGSLYTSVIPPLLVPEIAKAIVRRNAPKLYVCNIVTQPGETDGYSVADHAQAILRNVASSILHMPGSKGLLSGVIANKSHLPPELIEKYRAVNAQPVTADANRLKDLNLTLIEGALIDPAEQSSLRHHSKNLARVIMQWFRQAHPGWYKHKVLDELLSDSEAVMLGNNASCDSLSTPNALQSESASAAAEPVRDKVF